MAKKFGKFLLFTAAAGTAAAAVYYYIRKKEAAYSVSGDNDDDYDDFSDDFEDDADSSRNYVPLHMENTNSTEDAETSENDFTPLSEHAEDASQTPGEVLEETVEEFFDEEDGNDEEPPITES